MLSEKNASRWIMYELNSLSATITQKILSVNLNNGPLYLIRIYQNGTNIKESMSKFVISTVSADGLVCLSDKAFSVPVKTKERLG